MRAILALGGTTLMMLTLGFGSPAAAGSLSVDQLRERCAEKLTEEFGAAEAAFRIVRRTARFDMAFGRLQMTDGSTRQIRCRVSRTGSLDVNFRANGSGTDAWTGERPANAGYIETEEEKAERLAKEAAAEKERAADEDSAQAGDAAKDAASHNTEDAARQDQASGTTDAAAEEEDRSRPRFMKVKTN